MASGECHNTRAHDHRFPFNASAAATPKVLASLLDNMNILKSSSFPFCSSRPNLLLFQFPSVLSGFYVFNFLRSRRIKSPRIMEGQLGRRQNKSSLAALEKPSNLTNAPFQTCKAESILRLLYGIKDQMNIITK